MPELPQIAVIGRYGYFKTKLNENTNYRIQRLGNIF
jgi:hypothetical protein